MARFLWDSINSIVGFLPKVIKYLSHNSSLLTLITAIIAVCTLREMARQRRESYKPRLMFQNKNFFLQKNPNGTPCFLKETPDPAQDLYGPQFSLELKNIGLGSAHDIVVKWDYDQKRMLRCLREYAEKTKLVRENHKDKNHFEFMFNQDAHEGFGFFIEECQKERTMMAFLCSNDTVGIRFPDTLHSYITMVPYLELIAQGRPRRVDVEPQKIGVVFDFVDIGGKKQHQRLNMVIKAYSSQEDDDKNYGYGSISFSTR
jgi:hypothetical protein